MPTSQVCFDRPGARVDRDDLVLAVERRVEGGAVGRVGEAGRQRPLVLGRDRDLGAVTEGPVVVDREPGQAGRVGHPEERAVGRVEGTLLADGVVGEPRVDTRGGAAAPDELVGRQVEDLQRHRAVGGRGRQEPAVGADGGTHELAVRRHETFAQGLEDLVGGDLQPIGVLRADLVLAEADGRAVGDTTGDGEGQPAGNGAERRRAGEAPTSGLHHAVACHIHQEPFFGVALALPSRSTTPSNCHSGFGAWAERVWTWK